MVSAGIYARNSHATSAAAANNATKVIFLFINLII